MKRLKRARPRGALVFRPRPVRPAADHQQTPKIRLITSFAVENRLFEYRRNFVLSRCGEVREGDFIMQIGKS